MEKGITGTIVEFEFEGKSIWSFVNNPEDLIQNQHFIGRFYETRELKMISPYFKKDTRYLDVGCNIGNHTIYLGKKFGLLGMVVIEPNPWTIRILNINLALNNLINNVDTTLLGYGLSNVDGLASMSFNPKNLGGAWCKPNPNGDVKITSGDKLLGNRDFDFIKIDVERMEIECLEGMNKLINRCRPAMFVEVTDPNFEKFNMWCSTNKYEVKDHIDFKKQINYLILPR